MKRHGHLFEQVVSFENLLLAAKKAARAKRLKRSVAGFYFHFENEIIALKEEIESRTYKPQDFSCFEIFEPKARQICSSAFRDRVVHHAICNVLEPLFEKRSIFDSYACRSGKGSHVAVVKCQYFSRRFRYFLKCDIKKFFDSVDHEVLKNLLKRILKDPKLLLLLDVIIDHKVPGSALGKGLPIGNLTSQHFANFYLGELDHFLKDHKRAKAYLRYMDDFILFSDSKEHLKDLLLRIEEFIREKLKLELKEKATLLAPVTEGIPFLGFRIYPNLIRMKRENLVRMRRKIKRKEILYARGKISDREITQSINSIIAHVSHVNSLSQRRKIFESSLNLA